MRAPGLRSVPPVTDDDGGDPLPPRPVPRRRTYTVAEAAAVLGISRAKAYECVRTGELRALQFGRRIVVPAVVLDELLGAAVNEPA